MRPREGSRASRVMWIALVCLLTRPEPAQGQAQTPLHRVRTAGLDSAMVGRVTAFFAPGDRAHANDLAALLDRAADYFQRDFGGSFPLYLAVLRPQTWFDPYDDDVPALYGVPWGWIPESLIGAPASLTEGILIQGPDEEANLRRVRFVMLHEYGHLAAKEYLHPQGRQLYSSVRWFEEMLATYFAYAFVHRADPDWARTGRREWAQVVQRDPPDSATLDWRFMARLPPQQSGQVYAWYQNLLNVRAADLYAEHGLDFLREVRDQLPWANSDEWTTDMLLTHLESFAPGFQLWAEQLRQGRYVGHQRP